MLLTLKKSIDQKNGNELVLVVKFDTSAAEVVEIVEVYAQNKNGVCIELEGDQFNPLIDSINWAEVALERLERAA